MPYTNAWNTTDPAGSVAANTIDTEIQKLRLQLQERVFATLFDSPYTDDPLVVRDIITGKQASKTIMFGPYGIAPEQLEDEYTWGEGFVASDSDGTIRINCPMPQGVTITKVEFLVDRLFCSSVVCSLMEAVFSASPSAPSSVASGSTSGAGANLVTASGLAIVVGANDYYYAKLAGVGGALNVGFAFYGVRITYDAPDGRNTY